MERNTLKTSKMHAGVPTGGKKTSLLAVEKKWHSWFKIPVKTKKKPLIPKKSLKTEKKNWIVLNPTQLNSGMESVCSEMSFWIQRVLLGASIGFWGAGKLQVSTDWSSPMFCRQNLLWPQLSHLLPETLKWKIRKYEKWWKYFSDRKWIMSKHHYSPQQTNLHESRIKDGWICVHPRPPQASWRGHHISGCN